MNTQITTNKHSHITPSELDLMRFKAMRNFRKSLYETGTASLYKEECPPDILKQWQQLQTWEEREFKSINVGDYVVYIYDDNLPIHIGKVLRISDDGESIYTDTDGWLVAGEYIKLQRPASAYDVYKAVDESLRCLPFSGRCLGVHQNQWNEWIAECEVNNAAINGIPQKLRCQKMVQICQFRPGDDYPGIVLWNAKDDKREMTFGEESGIHEYEPDSPYIMEYIEEYNNHQTAANDIW